MNVAYSDMGVFFPPGASECALILVSCALSQLWMSEAQGEGEGEGEETEQAAEKNWNFREKKKQNKTKTHIFYLSPA